MFFANSPAAQIAVNTHRLNHTQNSISVVWLDDLALILMLPVWQVTLLNCAALARFMHTANNDGLAQVCIAHERKGSDELLATKEDTKTNARSNTASKTQEVKCSGPVVTLPLGEFCSPELRTSTSVQQPAPIPSTAGRFV